MSSILENKQSIDERVSKALQRVSRSEDSARVIAVTKYVDVKTVQELLSTGISNIGENRVDKFLEKYHVLKDENVTWHLIGTLQRRKVKEVINLIDYFHALDSVNLAKEIQKRANHPIKCFLQVNISKEESKHGFTLEQIDEAIAQISEYDKVQLVGIMTMAPFGADDQTLINLFSQANHLREDLMAKKLPHMPFTELSMGMSNDFELALENGATFVRIGTAFFE